MRDYTVPFRAVLLDSDLDDCIHFRSLLLRYPSVQLVGESHSFKEALELIHTTHADILFLESEVEGRFILEECRLIPSSVKLIFLTRHPGAAVCAFELDALDFLVKPLSSSRFAETICRLSRIDWKRSQLPPSTQHSPHLSSVLIPFERGRRGASIDDIVLIQAFGNYTRVTFDEGKGKSEIVLRSLTKWEQMLPSPLFLRVHRNAIVHTQKVRSLELTQTGNVLCIQGCNEAVPVSRRCLPEVRRILFVAA